MAQPILLQDTWTRMITDVPRDELPADAVWLMSDFIPNLGGNLQTTASSGRLSKRGGWVFASEDVSIDSTSATSITAMGYLESPSRLCLTTNNNKFGYIALPADGPEDYVEVSTSSIQSLQPYFMVSSNRLIILNNDGTTAVKSYDGTTFGNLAGSPPTGKYGTAFGDRIIIGNTAANPRRTFFSELGGTTWDTTYAYWDALFPVTGYAALPNATLVFGSDRTSRIRGRVPPPDSPDMAFDDTLFNVGCTFPNSIAVNGPNCVFANEEGVFLTNGTSLVQDVTRLCGVKQVWNAVAARAIRPSGVTVGGLSNLYGGFIGNYYLACLRPTNLPDSALLFDLTNMSCTSFTNFGANSVVMTPQVGDELYFGIGTRVAATSTIFMPSAQNKTDANGVFIEPSLETRFYLDASAGRNRWRYGYLDYRLTDPATDNPLLLVSTITDPSETVYTLRSYLQETTEEIRHKLPIREASRGVAFKVVQTGNSSETIITSLSADVYAREGGRVG